MNNAELEKLSNDERLGSLIAEFLDADRAGLSPDRHALFACHPDLVEELQSFFQRHDWMRDTAGAAGPLGLPNADDATTRGGAGNTEIIESECIESPPLRRFGDYELLSELGRGGMGVVYETRQVSLNRPVALKMMLSGSLATDEEVERFYTEARASARLRHSNIVAIHEVGEHEGQHYFSMDLIHGPSLADLIAIGPLEVVRAARYVRAIALAVQSVHEHGTLHRDLKPSNVLIDETDQPQLTDFGLAKHLRGDCELTATGAAVGTPSYMAPEQVRADRQALGPTTDVYSLGGLLYAALTAHPPFRGGSTFETMQQVLESPPRPPSELVDVPPDLEAICLKALQKAPGQRYQTANALAADLDRFLANKPPTAFRQPPRSGPSVASITALLAGTLSLLATAAIGWIPLVGALVVMLIGSLAIVAGIVGSHTAREARNRRRALIGIGVAVVSIVITIGLQAIVGPRVIGNVINNVFASVANEVSWRDFAGQWQPPGKDASIQELFPSRVGAFMRTNTDRQARVKELRIEVDGYRASYESDGGRVDIYAYPLTQLEQEAIMARVAEAIQDSDDPFDNPTIPGIQRTHGVIERWSLSLDPYDGNAAFWWDGQWLFFARTDLHADDFLLKYLSELHAGRNASTDTLVEEGQL
jgi:hypothetical protein